MNNRYSIRHLERPSDTGSLWVYVTLMGPDFSMNEEMMLPLSDWTTQSKTGQRMAFDMWRFDSEANMMAFMLRWDGQPIAI